MKSFNRPSSFSSDEEEMKLKIVLEYFDKASFFLSWNFFRNTTGNFSAHLSKIFKLSERFAWSICLSYSKDIVTSRRTNQIIRQENWKNLKFWEKKISNWGWDILTKPHFSRWNFLPKAAEMFFCRFYGRDQGIWQVHLARSLDRLKKLRPLDEPMRL